MPIREIIQQFSENPLLESKTTRHALYPRDFEIYLCGLELVTSEGDTIDYFSFPIMPDALTKSEHDRVSIYKTLGGVTVLNSNKFTPAQLTIKGNFGRTFKLLNSKLLPINTNDTSFGFRGLRFSNQAGVYTSDDVNSGFVLKTPEHHPTIKTGYACIKILQSIINKAKSNDNGKPFRLYFYNPILSESYLVVPTKNPLVLSQEVGTNNMMWGYTLNLDIIAPLESLFFGNKELANIDFLASEEINKGVNDMARQVSKYIQR